MGSYTFKWEHPGDNVVVTGDFDSWKQTIQLEKHDGIFQKTVELPKAKHSYKFVVDGVWKHNDSAPKEDDGTGGYNNVLSPESIGDTVSTLSSAAPVSTTAALAGAVPKEGASKSEESIPGAFPATPFETPATEAQTFSVNPIPATEGPGNPVKLAPGEKVPDPSTLTSNTVSSTAKTDAASYEKSDAVPPQLGPVVTPEAEREAKGDPGVTVQSAAPTSTTAALAGQVPLEPKGVPAAVTESQKEAGFPAEASANPVAVEEKKEVEQELKEKVPEEPATTGASTTEKVAATAAAGAAAATAGAAYVASSAKEKAEEAVGVNGQPTESEVPAVVKESQKEAHASPEASANVEAVEEKKEVEAELLKEVKKTDEAGEPAPTITAATTETAPALSDDALVDSKPLKSSSEPDALNAPATKPAQLAPEANKSPADSRDISPMSKQPTTTEQTQPTVTTGAETSKTEAKTAPETPKKETTAESSKATPGSVASGATDKKKKRRSIFSKIKEKLSH